MLHDLRHAVRLLLKAPTFSAVAVMVLALGIGANTAVFSVVNAMILRPAPGDRPGVLGIYNRDLTRPDRYRSFSWAAYEHVRSSREPFDSVLAYTMTMVGVTEGDFTRRSFSAVVSASYFSTLGVRLAAGREFTADEERPDSEQRVVIVGHQYARKNAMSPSEALGKTLKLSARDFTIVGVAPEGFAGPMPLVAPEFWLPTGVYATVTDEAFRSSPSSRLGDPSTHALMMIGRLRPGVTAESAQPMLAALSQSLAASDPVENKAHELTVHRLSRTSISSAPQNDSSVVVVSALLMGVATLVLLISCLNLANMMLARGSSRRKEIAVRLALGSGPARVMRQLLCESLILAAAGSAAGLLIAIFGARFFVASLSSALPLVVTLDPTPDVRVLAATAGFCVLSTIVAGLMPAWRATRPDVLPDLKEQPVDHGAGRRLTLRNALVVGQIALSLALLTAAGLFTRGAVKAAAADPGFPLDGGLLAEVDTGMAGYDENRGRATFRTILQRVRTMPGVEAASAASLVPFGEFRMSELVQKAGTPPAPQGQRPEGVEATSTIVGADYFDALRLPILRGRGFTPTEEESADAPAVVIVDEPLARRLFGDEDPLGRALQFVRDERPMTEYTVVGIVAGVRHDLFDAAPVPHVYVATGRHYRGRQILHVRSTSTMAESAVARDVREAIRAADSQVPVMQIRTLREHRDKSLALWAVKAGAGVFTIFGGVAIALAMIGVYGVKSYLVSRRTREIGIRMALGATGSDVLWLVLRDGLILTLAGIGIGLLLAWGVATALSGMLYQVRALDPIVFTVAPLFLVSAAMAASYLPARRATRVLPLTALRTE
jgi:predicted permease